MASSQQQPEPQQQPKPEQQAADADALFRSGQERNELEALSRSVTPPGSDARA